MLHSAIRSLRCYRATRNHPMRPAQFRAHLEANYQPEVLRAAYIKSSGLRLVSGAPMNTTRRKH